MSQRIVITGSRKWGVISEDPAVGSSPMVARAERGAMHWALDAVLKDFDLMVLVHGAARGADTCGRIWADRHGIEVEPHPADWAHLGKRAGPYRNAQMIAERTEMVLAFWSTGKDPNRLSAGTRNMITLARRRGIPTFVFRSPFWFDDSLDELPTDQPTGAPTGTLL